MNMLLLIYPALLLFLVFFRAQICHKLEDEKGGRDHFLNIDQGKMIEGAACVGIVLHHLTQEITTYGIVSQGPITVLNYMGILFTALFFFFSGYGLIVSVYTKQDYLTYFLQKRLPTVLIPFWVINALGYVLRTKVYGVHYNLKQTLSFLSGLTLINGNGWFIVEIVILYLIFYLLFRLIPKKDIALVLLCAATVALIVYGFHQGHDLPGAQIHWFKGEWWYNSTAAFIFGLLYARFGAKVTSFCRRHYVPVVIIIFILAVAFLHTSIYCLARYGYYRTGNMAQVRFSALITLASQIAACIISTMLVLVLNMKIMLTNPVLRYLGRISRELFLIHNYFIAWIFNAFRMNNFFRFGAVLLCSIACASILTPCINYLIKGVQHLTMQIPVRRKPAAAKNHRSSAKRYGIIALVLAGIAIAALLIAAMTRNVRARQEYESQCQALKVAKAGDTVLWGRFETDPEKFGKERLPWIVLAKEDDRVFLLCEEGIDGNCYHQKHESVTWEDCDLRRLLNSETYHNIFSRYERQSMLTVEGDLVSLLSEDQAMIYLPDKEQRRVSSTKEAIHRGANADRLSHEDVWYDKRYSNSWWWLRGEKGKSSITAPIVDLDGEILPDQKEVNKPSGAIRPVIWVCLSNP